MHGWQPCRSEACSGETTFLQNSQMHVAPTPTSSIALANHHTPLDVGVGATFCETLWRACALQTRASVYTFPLVCVFTLSCDSFCQSSFDESLKCFRLSASGWMKRRRHRSETTTGASTMKKTNIHSSHPYETFNTSGVDQNLWKKYIYCMMSNLFIVPGNFCYCCCCWYFLPWAVKELFCFEEVNNTSKRPSWKWDCSVLRNVVVSVQGCNMPHATSGWPCDSATSSVGTWQHVTHPARTNRARLNRDPTWIVLFGHPWTWSGKVLVSLSH